MPGAFLCDRFGRSKNRWSQALDSCFFSRRRTVRFHYGLPLQDKPVLGRLREPRERVVEAIRLQQYLPALEGFRKLTQKAEGIVLGSSTPTGAF